ncbi:hypothetical protein [Bradyrhizobium sp. USDA 223]|uniref:hypothetical protein n=1 Tax=Bradyrhizobium sp. USDA 223 TaxID=3156306 RepID=UPI0038354B46
MTEATSAMKRLALKQLDVVAGRDVFKQLGLEDICFEMKVVEKTAPGSGIGTLDAY